MLNERDLLALLCHFITTRQFVTGDKASIEDMVVRYKYPPLTLLFPVAIRLSVKDSDQLNELLKQAHELLSINEVQDALQSPGDARDRISDLSLDAARVERSGTL